MADRKSDTMQKLVQAAMRKPGMKERLAQVVPIVKAMGPAQRLALAGMVMGKGGQTQNMNNRMLNAQLLLPISHDIAAMLRNGAAESSARASSGYGVSLTIIVGRVTLTASAAVSGGGCFRNVAVQGHAEPIMEGSNRPPLYFGVVT